MTSGRLEGRVFVVTGGARGIGLAIAGALRTEGARVVVADLSPPPDDLAGAGLEGQRVDVTDLAAVRQMFADIRARHGRVGGLVNNAGVLLSGAIGSVTAAEWQRVMRVNLDAVFFVTQAALPHFDDRGTIVNVASTSGFLVGREQAVYEASKAGVVMLTRSLAVELAARGLRVNGVAPGLIDTPLTRGLFGTPDRFDERVRDKVPLGRAGRPADVADAAVFLSSEESGYMTGETLVVDGGWMLP